MKKILPLKKTFTSTPIRLSAILLTMGAGLLGGSQASAAVIAQDDFSYLDGDLLGKGSATDLGWDEAWRGNTDFTVTNGVVTQTAAWRRIHRNLSAAQGTDGTTVFIGIDNAIGNSFSAIEFRNGGDDDNLRNFSIGNNGGTEGFYANGITTIASSSAAFARYVIQINYGVGAADDTGEFFRDGVSQGTFSTSDDLSFDRIAFGGFGGPVLATDNLIIATTYAEAAAVPEPSSAALLGLGGLALILRRRK